MGYVVKRKTASAAGRRREHGRGRPRNNRRDEQGEARRAYTTLNGRPHVELGRLRLTNWSRAHFSIHEMTWPTYLILRTFNNTVGTSVFRAPILLAEARSPPALGQCGGEVRAAVVGPRGNSIISPHPGKIGPHPRFRNSFIHLQLRRIGDESGDSPGRHRPERCGNPKHTLADR